MLIACEPQCLRFLGEFPVRYFRRPTDMRRQSQDRRVQQGPEAVCGFDAVRLRAGLNIDNACIHTAFLIACADVMREPLGHLPHRRLVPERGGPDDGRA
jgi:hypothetical protein